MANTINLHSINAKYFQFDYQIEYFVYFFCDLIFHLLVNMDRKVPYKLDLFRISNFIILFLMMKFILQYRLCLFMIFLTQLWKIKNAEKPYITFYLL